MYSICTNDREYLILHDLRLRDQNGFFQIDTLILCEKYLLILEVKNWSGTIVFGENGQVTRMDAEQKEEGFPNPIPRANFKREGIKNCRTNNDRKTIQSNNSAEISSTRTIIKSSHPKH